MSYSAFKSYTALDLRLFFRTFIALFFTFVLPVAAFTALALSSPGGVLAFGQGYTPAFIGLIATLVAFYTIAAQTVLYREMGYFKRLLVTPMTTNTIMCASIFRGLIVVCTGLLLLLATNLLLTGALPAFSPLQFVVAMIFVSTTLFLVGLALATFFSRVTTVFTVATIAIYPIVFLSGAVFDLATMPSWFGRVAYSLPPFHALRLLMLGWTGQLASLAALGSLAYVASVALICWFIVRRRFSWF